MMTASQHEDMTLDMKQEQNSLIEENNYDIEGLLIFGAISEILKLILSEGTGHDVSVKIKSTKGLKTLASSSWFYIKVSTTLVVAKDIFQALPCDSALLSVLSSMQEFEHESHLCLLFPDGNRGCTQQSLYLDNGDLVVQHEVTKHKPTRESMVHLRVHENEGHMMRQGQLLYKYMLLLRVFRPTISLDFSMKMGDIVSQSDFRISSQASIGSGLPDVVTDSIFYTHESDMVPVHEMSSPSTIGPVSVTYRDASGDVVPLRVSCIGHYISVTSGSADTSTIALTLLGPACLPLTTAPSGPALLDTLDLLKNGLKLVATSEVDTCSSKDLLPYHFLIRVKSVRRSLQLDMFLLPMFLIVDCDSKDFSWLEANTDRIRGQCQSVLANTVQRSVDQILQPVLDNLKTRQVVTKSIRCVARAVTDIVSMSDNEDFRAAVLRNLQVESSSDVAATLTARLTDLSRQKHHGVWAGTKPPNYSQYAYEMSQTIPDIEDGVTETELASTPVHQTLTTETASKQTIDRDGKHITIQDKCSTTSAHHSIVPNRCSTTSSYTTVTADDVRCRTETVVEIGTEGKIMSPFQELMESEHIDPTPECSELDSGLYAEERGVDDSTEPVVMIGEDEKLMSPFQELMESEHMDNVPQCSELDRGLYAEGMAGFGDSSGLHSEKPVGNLYKKMNRTDLQSEEPLGKLYTLGSKNQSNVENIVMTSDAVRYKHNQDTTSTNLNLVQEIMTECNSPISKKDFEFLHSEDWEPTFNVVSSCIDRAVVQKENNLSKSEIAHHGDTAVVQKENMLRKSDLTVHDGVRTEERELCSTRQQDSSHVSGNDGTIVCAMSDDFVGVNSKGKGTVNGKSEATANTDDWFDDVLMDVQNWID